MRVVNKRHALLSTLIELVGIKSGLLLTQEQLLDFLERTYESVDKITSVLGGSSKWWQGNPEDHVAIRAEELEANFILAMYSVGAIADQRTPSKLIFDFVYQEICGSNSDRSLEEMEQIEGNCLDLEMRFAQGNFPKGAKELFTEYQRRDVMDRNMPVQREWDDIIPLSDLFESEDIPPNIPPGRYFDQRYIDYLNAQFDDLSAIHWRQLEYLTGEYFRQQGYKVKITPPRGDGGIDVIAEKADSAVGPDLVVIQCKHYSSKHPVSIEEIRAFWTSIDEHHATKGLIVTTSRLTSGGNKFVEARKYRLSAIEAENLKKWLSALCSHTRVQ